MRTHGWGGVAPINDEEAVERILGAAADAIEGDGSEVRVAEVARALGVSRQTIYNYFPGQKALVEALVHRSGALLIDRLAAHLVGITDPAHALVESMAFTLEWLMDDKPVQLMLARDAGRFSAGVASHRARRFGRGILKGLDVDWTPLGLRDGDIDDVLDYMLRILQSFIIDPGDPPRRGRLLRNYLRRWVVPVLLAETGG